MGTRQEKIGTIIPNRKNAISALAYFTFTLLITNATGHPRTTMPRSVRTATTVLLRKYLGMDEIVSALI